MECEKPHAKVCRPEQHLQLHQLPARLLQLAGNTATTFQTFLKTEHLQLSEHTSQAKKGRLSETNCQRLQSQLLKPITAENNEGLGPTNPCISESQ